jgi:hypothetical protein
MTLKEEIADILHSAGLNKKMSGYESEFILSLIRAKVEAIENPYGFMNGGSIPKWEKQYKGFESARQSILEILK